MYYDPVVDAGSGCGCDSGSVWGSVERSDVEVVGSW